MTVAMTGKAGIMGKVGEACALIAPLWPLKNFVAANPYLGLTPQSFWQAHGTLERSAGRGLCMPLEYYREQMDQGRITRNDIREALRQLRCDWDVPAFEQALTRSASPHARPWPLLAQVLADFDGQDWGNFVRERISRYCSAYFDEGQALWPMPWRDAALYGGWRQYARVDKSPRVMGLRGVRQAMEEWPDNGHDAIIRALQILQVPSEATVDYLHASLLSVGGWAGWTRYLRWQAELEGGLDNAIEDLLAIRLSWDALLYQLRSSEGLETRWQKSLKVMTSAPRSINKDGLVVSVLHTAFEVGYQRTLMASLLGGRERPEGPKRAAVQAAFCIDVRSEVIRRSIETTAPAVQTVGTAGFFGIAMEYLPLGSVAAHRHLPIFFKPAYRIAETLDGAGAQEVNRLRDRRRSRIHAAKAWKIFKTSASSCFAFVEAAGILSAPKLISNSMGWTRPVPLPARMGLARGERRRLGPSLGGGEMGSHAHKDGRLGIPEADRPCVAERVLRNMGITGDFARVVLLVGHQSSTVNNPQAAALDCGACAGQSGEASAQVAAALLNDPLTRRGLAQKGIDIPTDTYFLAGLHDTATDDITWISTGHEPPSHTADLMQLRHWLDEAGQMARMERAHSLGLGHAPGIVVRADMARRSRDWAEVRPEWGLAGNAAFIAAPRSRTVHRNLAGRAFLQEYQWRHDTNFETLQWIMTGPMIVAHWINMQYYGSVVDNRRLGSGNKVLHNVVGGSIGILEGNGGDLRAGLALQSLHDGSRWMHEPMRLNVIIEAPLPAIEDVIRRHQDVRELIDHEWMHLFQIAENGQVHRRNAGKFWRRYH